MKIKNFDLLNKYWHLLLFVPLAFAMSCGTDDPDPVAIEPIASFQFEVDASNFFQVTFSNFSQNATTYAWDFGDNAGTSTDKDPVYTYTTSGTFSVTLTAKDDDGNEAVKTESVTITDPDEALTLLAGASSKTWKLVREGVTMGLGPDEAQFTAWWFLMNDGSRNCIYDDEVTFARAGGFEFNDNGSMYGEGNVWNTDSDKAALLETCFDATAANMTVDGVDKSAWLSSTSHTYTYDVSAGSITLTGLGAWMGLVKLGTTGEVAEPQASTTFGAELISGGSSGVDTLNAKWAWDGTFWQVTYVSYANAADEPALISVFADFSAEANGATATFTNKSSGATSYTWDFGDGNSSTDADPVHTYAADDTYTVILTATDGTSSSEKTADIIIDTANPAAAATAPTQAEADVISIYSDAYTDISGVDFNPGWGQSTGYASYEISTGENAIKLSGLNYQGIDHIGNKQDVSGKTHVHLDVWAKEDATVGFFLISKTGADDISAETSTTLTIVGGQWNSFDILLTEYSSVVDLTSIAQFKFDDSPAAGTAPTFFYDNLYFY